jgi:hypothetical protein
MCTTVGNIVGNSGPRLLLVNDRLPIECQPVTWFPLTRQRRDYRVMSLRKSARDEWCGAPIVPQKLPRSDGLENYLDLE